ncbi:MAG: MATE family efflux transporter [Clostridiales bacterium]|nr:MATE family efflux transporter [Clostridiales bacterium]
MAKSFEMNMSEGSLLKKIIIYALPLVATNVLQLLFNAADVAVLGKFIHDKSMADAAVAAVGSTGALINLIIGLFVGLSVGANVLIARYAGKADEESAKKVVGMSMLVSVILGVVLLVIGYFGARTFLNWMDCPEEVIDMAAKYMRIFFIGMPIMMLYNFSASILRAVGDTLRPLIFLIIGGVINLGLNILFVLVFKKDVEGVAIATVTSQAISAVLCIITLLRSKGYCHLDVKYIRFYKRELIDMIKIGLPAGLQGCVFSISNVMIQSTINGFGKTVMAGNTVASQLEGFVYNACYSVSLTALAFVSQNYGAKKPERIRLVVKETLAVVFVLGLVLGGVMLLLARPLASIFNDNPEVIGFARERLLIVVTTYCICGMMDVLSNTMRGLGKSTTAMIVSLSGSCLFRILWLHTFFLLNPSRIMLYIVYPISWVLTVGIFLALYFPTMKKTTRLLKAD